MILGRNDFPVASPQQVRNINDKSVTSWQLPPRRGSFGETCVMDFGHYTTGGDCSASGSYTVANLRRFLCYLFIVFKVCDARMTS